MTRLSMFRSTRLSASTSLSTANSSMYLTFYLYNSVVDICNGVLGGLSSGEAGSPKKIWKSQRGGVYLYSNLLTYEKM